MSSSPVRFTSASAPLVGRSRRRAKPCPCGCGTLGLCEAHKARLAPIKAIVNPGTVALSRGRKKKPGRKRGVPICVNPVCGEQRVPPAAFCWECQQAGLVEEPT